MTEPLDPYAWEYKALLDWFMVSDPFPLCDEVHETILGFLDREAKERGFDSWVVAYHEIGRQQ